VKPSDKKLFLVVLLLVSTVNPFLIYGRTPPTNVTVTVQSKSKPINQFVPTNAMGGAIDGHDKGTIDKQLTPTNIEAMLSTGLKPLAYRLRTELAIDAWHWNPAGTWSDAEHSQGYWTSADNSSTPIHLSYGYKLPRRGNTIDQANNEDYSRLDDGDPQTFWKSNPYLDEHFTHEPNSMHPQWIVIDFNTPQKVNAIRLLWGVPFARKFQIQYATFEDPSNLSFNPNGMWKDFPHGEVNNAQGGETLIRLRSLPVQTRFVRILMTEPSGVATTGAGDIRDRLGYAMREVYAGTWAGGKLNDEIHHATNNKQQTIIYTSSTDPWHQQSDLDEGVEQAGFDFTYASGLTNGKPPLIPIPILYDTPDNAANEIRYLKSKDYPLDQIELGEEPDGQYATPEDYGSLYIQFTDAIHKVDPHLKLGGPSFQEILPDDGEYHLGASEWLRRFLAFLDTHHQSTDYSFFSFEWYPFDDVCSDVAPQLLQATNMLSASLKQMERSGLSSRIPWVISEYGYSAFASRAELGIEGALLNADIAGEFLALGGDETFLFGYMPGFVSQEVDCTVGNNMLFLMDGEGNIKHRFASYFAARLLTEQWLGHSDLPVQMFPVHITESSHKGELPLTAYAVHRNDEQWSLLLINKDSRNDYSVRLQSVNGRKRSLFTGDVDIYQYSSAQFALNNDFNNPAPVRAEPPEHTVSPARGVAQLMLPSYSITVVRGRSSEIKE